MLNLAVWRVSEILHVVACLVSKVYFKLNHYQSKLVVIGGFILSCSCAVIFKSCV